MTPSETKGPQKPARVLGDHKRLGKRFIPPMAQVGMSDARWSEILIPEFLWLALLHSHLGYMRGAEIARQVAQAARSEGDQTTWYSAMSMFATIADAKRTALTQALAHAGVVDELAESLAPIHRHYPDHPLAFALPVPAEAELAPLKALLQRLLTSRSDTDAMRAQATALYLAFDAGILRVLKGSALADFPEVEKYPETERSRSVGSAVRAALNALTIRIPKADWPAYFWNRGLQLEACSFEVRKR